MARSKWCLGVLVLALSGCPLFDIGKDDLGNSLEWQDPPPSNEMTWDDASSHCEGLSQGGHDDWRLPSIDELRTLVEGCPETEPGGACQVSGECSDASCSGHEASSASCSCEGSSPPEGGCFHVSGFSESCGCYKSSSAVSGGAPDSTYHWELCFDRGYVTSSPASTPMRVRCVRGSLGSGGSDDFGSGPAYNGPNGPNGAGGNGGPVDPGGGG